MNILYSLAESSISGANKSACILAEYMINQGNNVFVILSENGMIEEELNRRKIKYCVIKSYTWARDLKDKSHITTLKLFIKKYLNYIPIMKIRKIIKEKKIDIVHNNSSSSYVAIVAGQKEKVKTIWHFREFLEEDHGIKISSVFNHKKIINNCDKGIAISKVIVEKFNKIYRHLDIELVYNGIKEEDFEISNKLSFYNKKCNISIIGRVSKAKGQKDFIKAMELLKDEDICGRIIGNTDTQYAEEVRQYIEEKKLNNIEIIEEVYDIKKYYEISDIVIVASKCEAFGRVIIESMMSKCLVIGARSGAVPELIDNKVNGIIYESDDFEDLARKIKYAISNEEEMKKIINRAYLYAKKSFTSEKNAEKINKIYKSFK